MYGDNQHLVNHVLHPELRSENTLHVIGVCSNPVRYHSRYRIAREWIKHMVGTKCVHLTIVEAAFGDRHHEIQPENAEYDYVPVRVQTETWIKEAMINLGFRHVSVKYNAKYLAWIDMDVFFRDPNWAQETLHQLQHFPVVQPWQDCADLGPHGGIHQHFRSFGFQHQKRMPKQKHPSQKEYQYAHSGFAWACTRSFFEQVEGLMNFAILGSADHHMAFAMIGETKDTIHGKMHPSFFRKCYEWQAKALRITQGEVGFTTGRIEHWFHGPKKRRYYRERWQVLVDHLYDPDKDLITDSQGITILAGKPRLEQAIRMYNRSRFEDSIEEV